ncbi:lipid kinase [Ectothiorhodospira shaposhnikovii]|uniref:putative urea ABC transporter substrate-binding protein n=1 Tax=Ectothiorhodospira shaposhnikovii TaxID=1054 RepID=UPI00190666EA|nr:putative urea ABC transporter substrate-binding protein [Ectothiorhodospira shaposhnikovii]MBK1673604.1 lipid kinase [Ectothiorhodospira shaposhnikovii]
MSRPTRRLHRRLPAALAVATLCLSLILPGYTLAGERDRFSIAWSIYVGWMPWGYGAAEGIIDKWADKYGITIDVVQINDYIESINLYTAGRFDGVTLTNMDALTIPAAGGVDTTALIIGDFSSGNDGVVLKGSDDLKSIRGQRVHLVELSVSHYLLARALDSVGMSERDIRVVNTSDADIVAAFQSRGVQAAVTWNPQLEEIRRQPGAHVVFDSSRIPGEIIDMLGVNTAVLEANPRFGKALVGAWYEIMARMFGEDEAARQARAAMGDAAGTDLAGYEAQLASTTFFHDPSEAVAFITGPQPMETMEKVRQFAFQHGLLGERAASADFVGIAFPDGSVLGSPDNVRLRFDASFMRMAADGEL